MYKTGLIIIFNYRFDKNIPILRALYGKRFSKILFLVPFYNGTDEDVIPIYESSFQFQGYYIQAYPQIMQLGCDYYFFIADDLIIHPKWNETNIHSLLDSSRKSILIPPVAPLNRKKGFAWFHARDSAMKYDWTNWRAELPSFNEALNKYKNFMGEECKLSFSLPYFFGREIFLHPIQSLIFIRRTKLKVPYPLIMGYSDYFLIKREKLFDLARTCGIFASINLFVEIAFPTAVMLTFERSDVLLINETDYKEKILWTGQEKSSLNEKYGLSLLKLYEEWPDDSFCIHPVKLSQWNCEGFDEKV